MDPGTAAPRMPRVPGKGGRGDTPTSPSPSLSQGVWKKDGWQRQGGSSADPRDVPGSWGMVESCCGRYW